MPSRSLQKLICWFLGHPLRNVSVGTDRTSRVVATAVIRYCQCGKEILITGFGTKDV